MSTLLKKKAQTYNNSEVLKEVHEKATKTLEVLYKNLITGDLPLSRILTFY